MPFTTHTIGAGRRSNIVYKGNTAILYVVFERYRLYRRWNVITTKRLLLLIGTITLVALTTACGDDNSPSNSENVQAPDRANTQVPTAVAVLSSGGTSGSGSTLSSMVPANPGSSVVRSDGASTPIYQVSSGPAGIWVHGQGKLSLVPDLALLNLGVETTAKTVSKARNEAAKAMNAIIEAARRHDLSERDVQTTSFNVYPEYRYQEVTRNGMRINERILIGYRVNNSAVVKIRDMEKVGPIIDDVADAGGNATRINGISFTVEDTSSHQQQLRQQAVEQAVTNANHFAALTGVNLGKLIYITESGSPSSQARDFAGDGFLRAAEFAPTTPISGGELDLTMTVQAAFAIE